LATLCNHPSYKKEGKSALWECKVCGHENLGNEDACEECGSLRYEPAYDQIADEEDA
jgi:rubrerythrin